MATRREYYVLIKKLLPFAKASVLRRQPQKDQLAGDLTFTLYEGRVPGWGVDPFYLLLDGRIVRLTRDRDLNPRWLEINIETYDFGLNGWSSGPISDTNQDFGPQERSDGFVIAAMLDQLTTQPLRAMPVHIPADYPLEEVRQVLLRHAEKEAETNEEGSEWVPLFLLALGVLVFVAIVASVVLLTNDVQYH